MGFSFSVSTREVLEQVVRDPRAKVFTTIPVFSPITIGLLLLSYGFFFGVSYLYLLGELPLISMILINGFAVYVAFTPLHDATHRTASGSHVVNDLLGTIACFALLPGITTRIYRYLHLEHHRYSGDPNKDPDEPFVATHPVLLPFVLASADILWTVWYIRHWFDRPVTERVEFTFGIMFYVGWHVVWLLSPYAMEFFLIWMIPQRIGMFCVTYFFAHIQHPKDVLWEEAPFQATVFIKTHFLVRILMLGQTVHCLHHLMPSVPFYRYHKAWNLGKTLFEKQHVPVRTLFLPVKNLVIPQNVGKDLIEVNIVSITDVAKGVRTFELVAASADKKLPSFTAGAHIDVHISDGVVRQYSLCNNPLNAERYQIAVKCEEEGRGGSRVIHSDFHIGQKISISAPRNNFLLDLNDTDYVLVAGGIGITPILAMAHTLQNIGKTFSIHICARSLEFVPFADTLSELQFADRIHLHLDDGEDEQKFDIARDCGAASINKKLYLCGPGGFMSWVMKSLKKISWSDNNLHSETFVPRQLDNTENREFTVELAKSGKILTVAADEFLIDVLNRNKCGVPCSCTQGICGSCITTVKSGEPEHRDAVLSNTEREAGNKMCVCVGRAKGGHLVLDI